MEAIHRDDGELCGFVRERDGQWHATTVFGSLIEATDSPAAATQVVREVGLAALAERWLLLDGTSAEAEVVCIQEASPDGVTLALGYFSMPGVPTLRITRDEIDNGRYVLRRDR